MDIVLVPGLWLDASSWDDVAPLLEEAGHRAHALTLPGMESVDADRSSVTRADHVDAVVSAVDRVDHEQKVMLVGHSAGCGLAHAAIDARPEVIARAIHIGGFPIGDGSNSGEFPLENGEIPLPDWSLFDEADLVGLDETALAGFRARAIPSPALAVSQAQSLRDERRYEVPVTVVCTEFTSDVLRSWLDRDLEPVAELGRIREVTYVDLPTGHWPQFTRPKDLASVILGAPELA